MGILLDEKHWARAINKMWELRPPRHEPMPREQVAEFLQVACRSLSDLLEDPEFLPDLRYVAELSRKAGGVPPVASQEFTRFFEEFMRAERALLLQSGMDLDSASDLLEEIDQITQIIQHFDHDVVDLGGRLEFATKLACDSSWKEADVAEQESRIRDVWRVVKGGAIVGIDGAAAAAGTIFGGIVGGVVAAGPAAASVSFGSALIYDAVKNRF